MTFEMTFAGDPTSMDDDDLRSLNILLNETFSFASSIDYTIRSGSMIVVTTVIYDPSQTAVAMNLTQETIFESFTESILRHNYTMNLLQVSTVVHVAQPIESSDEFADTTPSTSSMLTPNTATSALSTSNASNDRTNMTITAVSVILLAMGVLTVVCRRRGRRSRRKSQQPAESTLSSVGAASIHVTDDKIRVSHVQPLTDQKADIRREFDNYAHVGWSQKERPPSGRRQVDVNNASASLELADENHTVLPPSIGVDEFYQHAIERTTPRYACADLKDVDTDHADSALCDEDETKVYMTLVKWEKSAPALTQAYDIPSSGYEDRGNDAGSGDADRDEVVHLALSNYTPNSAGRVLPSAMALPAPHTMDEDAQARIVSIEGSASNGTLSTTLSINHASNTRTARDGRRHSPTTSRALKTNQRTRPLTVRAPYAPDRTRAAPNAAFNVEMITATHSLAATTTSPTFPSAHAEAPGAATASERLSTASQQRGRRPRFSFRERKEACANKDESDASEAPTSSNVPARPPLPKRYKRVPRLTPSPSVKSTEMYKRQNALKITKPLTARLRTNASGDASRLTRVGNAMPNVGLPAFLFTRNVASAFLKKHRTLHDNTISSFDCPSPVERKVLRI